MDGSTLTDTATVTLDVVNFRLRNVGVTLNSTGVGGINASAVFVPSVGDSSPVTNPLPLSITHSKFRTSDLVPFSLQSLHYHSVPRNTTVSVTSAFNDSDSYQLRFPSAFVTRDLSIFATSWDKTFGRDSWSQSLRIDPHTGTRAGADGPSIRK